MAVLSGRWQQTGGADWRWPAHDNGDLAVELAAQGLGIGTGPCFIVRRYLENGRVRQVLPHYKTDVLNVYAVCRHANTCRQRCGCL